MQPPTSRAGRVLDLVALLLVIGGGIGWFMSYVGLERLRAAPHEAFSRGMSIDQLARFHELARLSYVAQGSVLLGITCGIVAWRLERKRRP